MDSTPSTRIRLVTTDPDWVLVDRYFSGECTPEEARAIDQWTTADPSHNRLLASMRRIWLEAATPLPAIDEADGWRAIQEKFRAAALRPAPTSRHRRPLQGWPVTSRWYWVGIAAAIAGVGVGLTISWRHIASARLAALPPRIYETARGERSEVTLVDGTRVWLNVDSKLVVPGRYAHDTRDIGLVGEAYFVVRHDSRQPFRVHAGTGVLEDVGTEFAVRAYPNDTTTVAVVASGRVSITPVDGSARSATPLGPAQMGTLDPSGAVQVVDHVDLEPWFGWMSGRLEFADRPLHEVARELERWYDITVGVDDTTLLGVPVTATFTTQSADEALSILTATLGVAYTREGRSVRIHLSRGHSH